MQQFRPDLQAHDLTDQQWRVIRALCEKESCDADGWADARLVAQRTSITMPSLSRISSSMGRKGLLEKMRPDEDKRLARLRVTKKGRTVFEAIAPRSEATYRRLERAFGQAELKSLRTLLERLVSVSNATPGSEDEPT